MNTVEYYDSETGMYMPPYSMLKKHIKGSRSGDGEITVSLALFESLIRLILESADFDEQQYQRCNPDVAEAIDRNEFSSGREHFVKVGYFEGRTGATPVHETWYLARNPDVAAAKKAGIIESGEAQYRLAGASEWRAPNPQVAQSVRVWKNALVLV